MKVYFGFVIPGSTNSVNLKVSAVGQDARMADIPALHVRTRSKGTLRFGKLERQQLCKELTLRTILYKCFGFLRLENYEEAIIRQCKNWI